jgi:hypothetical protein
MAPRALPRIDPQPARQSVLREITERYIGICQGRRGSAVSVGNRARHGSGAVRADMQSSGAVDCEDAAATGADLGDVDRRGSQQIPSTLIEPAAARDRATDLELARPPDLILLDNGRLSGRAAHIEADDIRYAEPTCHCGRADDPAAGPDSIS